MEMQQNKQIIEPALEGQVIVEPKAAPTIRKALKSLEQSDLLQALYFIWDAAERGQLDMFLIGDTAKQVKEDRDLSGNEITVGVRKNEWESGQGRIAQTFLEHELGIKPVEVDNEVVILDRNGTPIHIKLYEDNPTLKSFDIVFYRYETFNLPNPYKEFVEQYE